MSDDEARALHGQLGELGVKIDLLTELFNRAAHEDGFARCAGHHERLKHVEEDMELCHSRISGLNKWLVAGLVSVVSMLANFVWKVLQTSIEP